MLTDTHCHIDFADFDHDRADVIGRAAELGVSNIVVPAVSQAGWQQTIKVCSEYPALQLAPGMHPVFINQHQPQHLTELDKLIGTCAPVAVGEIGLDFYLTDLDREKQRVYFSKQLIIAKRHRLPVIIHNRKAHDECLNILRDIEVKGGIIHAFNGSIQQAQKYIGLGFLLGFGGMLTYPRSRKLRSLVERLELEHIVLETDAPDMSVSQHRGTRNSPEYLPFILEAVAGLKNVSKSKVISITSNNAQRMFGYAD